MKRRLLTIKKSGQGLLAGLFLLAVSGLFAVILAGEWLRGQGLSKAYAIPCFLLTLCGCIFVWRNWPAMRARDRLAAGLCPDCGYDLRESKQADVCPECGCQRRRSEAGGP